MNEQKVIEFTKSDAIVIHMALLEHEDRLRKRRNGESIIELSIVRKLIESIYRFLYGRKAGPEEGLIGGETQG
jgi:hypothetical protein